jgi:hypothetical protein
MSTEFSGDAMAVIETRRGYMEHEMCIDLESDSGRSTCWVLRCIQCGDIVEEVILQNRSSLSHEGVLVASA